MTKFNTPRTPARATSPVRSVETAVGTRNHQGGAGIKRDTRSELFLATVSHLNENTFYEAADARLARIRPLVAELAVSDPTWTKGLVGWLRSKANLRTVSIMVAAEAARARQVARVPGETRGIVAAAIGRADEPGEFLAYWDAQGFGALPKPVKRGLGDALGSTLNEYSFLRNKGADSAYSLRDVINLVHPDPVDQHQAALYKAVLDVAYGNAVDTEQLPMLTAANQFRALSPDQARELLKSPDAAARLRAAGVSWQNLSSALGGRIPDAGWKALISSMGYRELLMNLRSMEDAGLDGDGEKLVRERLANRELMARARLLPLEFLRAYRNTSLRFAHDLEQGLQASVENIARMPGSTLVLVDNSGSMGSPLSGRGSLKRLDAANLFGTVVALRAEAATLVSFGSDSHEVKFRKSDSALRVMDKFCDMGGTNTARAIEKHYAGHDRIVLLTDEQDSGYAWSYGWGRSGKTVQQALDALPAKTRVFTWNLAGYEHGSALSGGGNRHVFGGLTDAGFELLRLLDGGRSVDWPF